MLVNDRGNQLKGLEMKKLILLIGLLALTGSAYAGPASVTLVGFSAGGWQSQHAVEGMHLDFRVGPVKHRAPSEEVGVLHLFEGILNVVLRAIGQYNLFIGPVGVVGKQNGFAELDAT